MKYNQQRDQRKYQNTVNNAQGHFFESYIKAACNIYSERERAEIDKIPEPFRVLEKSRDGVFKGRFTAHAQPDFQGTLAGGRSIVFEAKYTTTDRMKQDVLTEDQEEALTHHASLGALAAVCVGIKDDSFLVPWEIWRDMKQLYGRKYVTAEDLEKFRVRFNGAVMFLDYIHEIGGRWISGIDCNMEEWKQHRPIC
ncbi:MAG: Holliday junction resolvase RecU [Anaerotignum propionicum]|nr:Holliday junction resolvase RecU [Anaerotignum propionicum]